MTYRPEDELDQKPSPKGGKDKARWCRGKVGREHDPVIVIDDRSILSGYIDMSVSCSDRARDKTRSRFWYDICRYRIECAKCQKVIVHSVDMHRKNMCQEFKNVMEK